MAILLTPTMPHHAMLPHSKASQHRLLLVVILIYTSGLCRAITVHVAYKSTARHDCPRTTRPGIHGAPDEQQ